MHLRMLADIERVQMKTKSAQLAQERIKQQFGQPLPAVFSQARAQQQEIALQFLRSRVGVRAARLVAREPHANPHEIQKMPVEFRLRNPLSPRRLCVHPRLIRFHRGLQLCRTARLAQRRAEFVNQPLDLYTVMFQDHISRQRERSHRAVRLDERIAVAIPADPRTEMQQLRKLFVIQRASVNLQIRFRKLRIQPRQRFEKGHGIKIQSHAHLINHAGLFHAHLIRLPQGSDLRENQRFVFRRVGRCQRQSVQVFQILRDAPPFQ